MTRQNRGLFEAVAGMAALLAVSGAAPAPAVAASTGPAAAGVHQYVSYGYYGFPSPYYGPPWPAVNYPGSGASAWLGYSAPYSTAGFPYGGYAYPYLAYANPYAAYATFAAGAGGGSPYTGSPGYPYTAWGGSYGSASGPTVTPPQPSEPRIYWDSTGYYVIP